MKRVCIYLPLLLALCALAAGCVVDDEADGVSLRAGDVCPEFSVVLTDGAVVSASSLRGAPALIVFFNTGCGDCRRELPVVQQAYDELTVENEGRAPQFVCIARDEAEGAIAEFWSENGLTLPVAAQKGDAVYKLFATLGIPRIYVVSPQGVICEAWGDGDSPSAARICSAVRAAGEIQ